MDASPRLVEIDASRAGRATLDRFYRDLHITIRQHEQ
jgi:hypothetical protein